MGNGSEKQSSNFQIRNLEIKTVGFGLIKCRFRKRRHFLFIVILKITTFSQ